MIRARKEQKVTDSNFFEGARQDTSVLVSRDALNALQLLCVITFTHLIVLCRNFEMISTPEPKNFYNNLQLKFIRTAQWTSFKLYHKAGGLKIVVYLLRSMWPIVHG